MELKFGYANGEQTVHVADRNLVGILTANEMEHVHLGEEAVRYALENPIGAPKLSAVVKPGQKIAIVISDISRPVPSWQLLPAILDELFGAGCKAEDITVNVCKKKHATNTRASGSDEALKLTPHSVLSLEQSLEFIADDELVEVTPTSIRMRKMILNREQRMKQMGKNKG